ncbi:(Fe-S)-binding protein [Syntrophomonas erecta]
MSGQNQNFFTTLENEALICARCGSCRSSCPVYQVIGWESATPRGKISLAKDVFVKGSELSQQFVERINQCTLCGACGTVCATSIDTRKLWLEIRKRIAAQGQAPKPFQQLRDNLVKNYNISTFPNQDRLEWSQDLDEDLDDREYLQGAEVCYFVGCVSSFFPQAAQIPLALAEIFTEADVNFTVMGGEEWCCGYPLLSSGFVEDMFPFIEHNVSAVKELGVSTMVTSCSTCFHVWKQDYAGALEGYPLEILHSTEFLYRLIKEGRLKLSELDELVTYHDPCDLGRNGGVFDAPREIIRSIPGVQLVELKHNREESLCCGGGGNLQSADPKLAEQITAIRVKEIEESGASIVVSACQQCEQMLFNAVRKAGLKVRVMDISELVLEAME